MFASSKVKIVIILLGWLICLLGSHLRNQVKKIDSQGQVKIVFCDVGQGDAILIADNNFQILVDGGPDQRVLNCMQEELEDDDLTIEVVFLTHADSDHLVGLTEVMKKYKIEKIVLNNLPKDSKDYEKFYQQVWEKIEKNDLKVMLPSFAQKWCETDNLCIEIWSKDEEFLPEDIFDKKYEFGELSALLKKSLPNSLSYNNSSIVVNLKVVDKNLTLTGDIEAKGELAMVESGLLTKVDVLKIAHHGSKSSSELKILELLRPEISVISVGAKNSFGHPHQIVLDRLEIIKSRVLRTDEHGKIKLIKRIGEQWQLTTSK